MEALYIPIIIIVFWLIMSKKTKKAIGRFIEVGAIASVDHLLMASNTAKANNLADVSEDFKERGIELKDIAQFDVELQNAFQQCQPVKPTTPRNPRRGRPPADKNKK